VTWDLHRDPVITTDGKTKLYVVWKNDENYEDSEREEIAYAYYDGSSWSKVTRITNDDGGHRYPMAPAIDRYFFPLVWTTGTATPYRIEFDRLEIQGYYGNDTVSTALYDEAIDTSTKKFAFRFMAQNSKTVNAIRFYVGGKGGTPPTYTVELRSDDGTNQHKPSSTVLTSGTVTPTAAGWWTVSVTNYAITAGTYYHIVIYSSSASSTNYIRVRYFAPINNTTDFIWIASTGSSWDYYAPDSSAVYVLDFTDSSYEGNPFYNNVADNVYSNSWWVGEKITVSSPLQVHGFRMFLEGITGRPADDLYYVLSEDGTSKRTGTLASRTIEDTKQWLTAVFSSGYTLMPSKTYRMYVKSPSSTSSGTYDFRYPTSTNSSPYTDLTWEGGSNGVLTYTSNQGSSWTDLADTDATFQLMKSLNTQVNSSNNDGWGTDEESWLYITGNSLSYYADQDFYSLVPIRFPDINIPKSATILNASLSGKAYFTSTTTNITVTIQGFDEDNTSAFTEGSSGWSDVDSTRSLTSASVTYVPPSYTQNSWYQTGDVSGIVSEIISRSGWTPGNALGFRLKSSATEWQAGETREWYSFDTGASNGPILSITFSEPLPENLLWLFLLGLFFPRFMKKKAERKPPEKKKPDDHHNRSEIIMKYTRNNRT